MISGQYNIQTGAAVTFNANDSFFFSGKDFRQCLDGPLDIVMAAEKSEDRIHGIATLLAHVSAPFDSSAVAVDERLAEPRLRRFLLRERPLDVLARFLRLAKRVGEEEASSA